MSGDAEISAPALAALLLGWYDIHRRRLPWRAPPGRKADPYRVWLSEIMLQQTTVAAAAPYFVKFVALWPTLEALARAPLDDVLKAWAGLGYYARARNLHACARHVVEAHGGRFPQEAEALRELPGIGAYTAAAIAAIAFDVRAAAVDGNAERVMARLFAIEEERPYAKHEIARRALTLVPPRRSGDFAQAVMDLGATICTPKSPNCLLCPWREACVGRKRGVAESLPRKAARRARPVRYGTAFWIEREGAVLLSRRPEAGLLGGLMEIPSTSWQEDKPDAMENAPLRALWQQGAGRIEHGFTHFHLVLDIWRAIDIETGELLRAGDYRWVATAHLEHEALPSVMRKIVAAILRTHPASWPGKDPAI
ncbi:MAG TPA: A/G-specific adenine glycosylase [Aestuariivirgaceae bacterium]|jgi:A/G-specific adenine glycosylase